MTEERETTMANSDWWMCGYDPAKSLPPLAVRLLGWTGEQFQFVFFIRPKADRDPEWRFSDFVRLPEGNQRAKVERWWYLPCVPQEEDND